MQVWEFDGIIHRDSVTNPLFLRIWKEILQGAMAFAHSYRETREHMMNKMWQEIDNSGSLGSTYKWLGDVSKEGAIIGATGQKLPTSDEGMRVHIDVSCSFAVPKIYSRPATDCYWDYALVRCARPRFCEYQFQVGDLHLSQSCRLRKGAPLAKDDPTLLMQDAEAYNVSYYVGPDLVVYQPVYRPQDPGIVQPWVHLMMAFLGGAAALALVIFLAFRTYGADRVLRNLRRE